MEVLFLNAGQGDSTLLKFDDNNYMLVDTNLDFDDPGVDIPKVLADKIPITKKDGKQVKILNQLVITHPHEDHIHGIKEINESKELLIGELWDSGHEYEESNNPHYDYLVKLREEISVRTPKSSSKPIKINDDTDIYVIWPKRKVKARKAEDSRSDIHAQCMVLKVVHKGVSILFAGDSNYTAWEDILLKFPEEDYPDLLKADILHASHHGSRSFFKKNNKEDDDADESFINRISPKYVIICCGASQDEHPHDDALKIYKKNNRKVYRTDQDKTIFLNITGQNTFNIVTDKEDGEEFQEKYALTKPNEDDGNKKSKSENANQPAAYRVTGSRTRLDDNAPSA